jgi:hypothetical protein
VFSIIALLLLYMSISLVAAQYTTQKTVDVTLGSDGTFTADESDIGVSYEIQGTAGATGTVTASVYNGNPQATASVPSGISLKYFVVVTFDMSASDFTQATITISYSGSDVANLQQPYAVYKYLADNNSFVALPTTVDETAKTVSVTLISVDDPLLAIGGSATEASILSPADWLNVSLITLAIFIAALLVVVLWRKEKI